MTEYAFKSEKLSPSIGLQIWGVDPSKPLPDAVIADLRRAWLDHLVIFLRDIDITPAQQLALAKQFGEPAEYPFVKGIDGFPSITPVLKLPDETVNFGGIWHTDTAYLPEPPMGTMLYAQELPEIGGDTLFANQYRAFEDLSEGMKALLRGRRGVNASAKADVTRTREDRIADGGTKSADKSLQAIHPVVRTHPETGRQSLYVNFGHTICFEGLTEAESQPLLDYLFSQQNRPEISCRFAWQPGSLAFWDNRACQHYPVNDYHGHKRLLHRITFKGDTPV
jgi:taurine dioxygenase